MKTAEVAEKLGCRVEGDAGLEITGVAGLEHAQPGQLSFMANRRYFPLLRTTHASAVLLDERTPVERAEGLPRLTALRSANPYFAFARALELFYQPPSYPPGIHPTAVVAASARVGEDAHVGPYCFVDEGAVIGRRAVLHSFVAVYRGVQIGDDFFAHAHAVVREYCRIGDRVTLQNGVVIGADGFGFAALPDGSWRKIVQSGITVLEDDVEVQSNSCVDRATVGETRIGRGSKLDDLVLVGHASRVGANSMLCGQVGLAGSTKVGDRCIFAGQAASSGHLSVGDGAVITAQSGLPGDVPAKAVYSGSPAVENRLWLKSVAALNRLPDLQRRVRELEERIRQFGAESAAG